MKYTNLRKIAQIIKMRVASVLAVVVRKLARMHTKAFAKRSSSLIMAGVLFLTLLPAFLLTGLFAPHAKAASASQGPRTATSSSDCVNATGVGTVAWTAPGNAYTNDSNTATVSVDGTTSNYIQCTNFGFSIPSGVTIAGMVVTLTRFASSNANGGDQDAAIRLVKGGVVGTTDRSTTTIYPLTSTDEAHGTNSDLWGTTWAPSDINATNFGAAIAVKKASGGGTAHTVSVDAVTITVTYTFNPTFNQSTYQWFNNQDASGGMGFAKAWGGTGLDNISSMARTSDGGYIATGYTYSFGVISASSPDMILVKYDNTGNVTWAKTWGGTGEDYGQGVIQTSDGGYAVAGYTSSAGAGSDDAFLAKYDQYGTLTWINTWGGTNTDMGRALVQTSDGGYAITGHTASYTANAGAFNVFLAKFTSSGSLSWSKTWGGTIGDDANAIIQTKDGGYAIAGNTSIGGNLVLLLKYDSAGNLSWSKSWGGTGNTETASSLIQTSDGGYAVTGYTNSFGAGSNDSFFLKFDSSGNLTWNKVAGGASSDGASSIIQTNDGGYVLAGHSSSYTTSDNALLMKYDSVGNLLWSKTWGGTSSASGGTVVQTSDGGYTEAGVTASYGAGSNDFLLLKYDSAGNMGGCSSPMCQGQTLTVLSPTVSVASPAGTVSSPTPTVNAATATITSPSGTSTTIISLTPTIDVGTPLNGVSQNTATQALAEQSIFRLRMALHVATDTAIAGYFSFKLQYAQRGSDNVCDTSFTGETYTDVTSSTPMAYGDNPIASDGLNLVSNANDPSHGTDTMVRQEYNESNNTNVVNNIAAGQDGLWDFALKDNGAPASTPYCFRLVTDTGATLAGGYTVIPQITTLPPGFSQENYRWFKGQDAAANNNFVQTIGGTNIDTGNSVIQTTDGGYAALTETSSYGAGSSDIMLSKYDSTGTLGWSKTWGGTGAENATAVIQTTDGGYAVAGSTQSFGAGSYDAVILKYDSSGNLQWSKTWGGANPDYGTALMQTSNGGYVLAGYQSSYGAGNTDAFLAKFDTSGNLLWSKTWGGANSDQAYAVTETPGQGIAVTGYTNGYGAGGADMFLAKFDTSGNLLWSKTWGGTGNDYGYSIITTSDGGYAVTGYTTSFGGGVEDMYLAKFDSSGTLQWNKTWGGSGSDYGYSLVQTSDGGYAVTGSTASYGVGNADIYLAKFDTSGNLLWSKTWGGNVGESANSIALTKDAGFIVLGKTYSFVDSTNGEAVLIKFDGSGQINGCASSMCTAPTAATTTPAATVSSPAASTSSPAATVSVPAGSISTPIPTVTAIAGSLTFAKTFGGAGSEAGKAIAQSPSGGYAIAGDTASFGAGGKDLLIASYDSTGSLLWTHTWGGTGGDVFGSIASTADGGYVMTGTTKSFSDTAAGDIIIVKYDSAGNLSWSNTWGGSGTSDQGNAVIQTSDGGYAVTGATASFGAGSGDSVLIKYDSSGNVSWSQTWGGTGSDAGQSLVQTSDGGYAVTGTTLSFGGGGNDMFIAKYDSAGNLTWNATWGGTGNDYGNSIIQTSDKGYLVGGDTASYANGGASNDAFLAKFDSSGTLQWSKTWGGTASDAGNAVIQASDGGYVLTGYTNSYGAGGSDIFLAKFDSSGTLQWSKTWGGTGSETGYSLVQTAGTGYAVSASTSSYGAGSDDMVLLKYDSSGNIKGCNSPLCQSPAATTGSPAAATTNPSATTGSPVTAVIASASPTNSVPGATDTYQISKAVWGLADPVLGLPLGAQDTAGSVRRHDDPLRLRFILKNVKTVLAGGASLKLQVSPKVGTCDTGFVGETYVDVGSSVSFNYYDNSNLASGDWARSGLYDPTPAAGSLYYANYQESANFTNRRTLVPQQNALWDISLGSTTDAAYNSYCFRVVNSDNSLLLGYTRVFELSLPPAMKQKMRHGQTFNEQPSGNADSRQPLYW